MKKIPTKLNPATVWAEAFPVYFALKNRMVRLKCTLTTDDELAALIDPKAVRAFIAKMRRKSYTSAWSKTHKKSEASRLAAKLKRCGVARG